MTAPAHHHLDDAKLQALAEGILRGPEGASARADCESCAECGEGLALYQGLVGQLDRLVDPPPPPDFTARVLDAVAQRQEQLAARRHIQLAAIPGVLVAALAVIGWAWSVAPGQRLDQLLTDLTVVRQVCAVALPALAVARLPLVGGALLACLVVGVLLARALRTGSGAVAR